MQTRPATLLKKRLWHRCFLVNFVKFLRASFLQNISGRLLLCQTVLKTLSNIYDRCRVLNTPSEFMYLCIYVEEPVALFSCAFVWHLALFNSFKTKSVKLNHLSATYYCCESSFLLTFIWDFYICGWSSNNFLKKAIKTFGQH